MPAVVVMRSMALGDGGDDKEENSFSDWRHRHPPKGEADNSRHGFLYLYQPITEGANNGLTPELASPQAAATPTELPKMRTYSKL